MMRIATVIVDEGAFRVFDMRDFPVIWLRAASVVSGYALPWMIEMELILGLRQPFVVIFEEGSPEESVEDRKLRAVWLKKNKEALNPFCRSLIAIESNRLKREVMKAQLALAVKAFNVPADIADSVAEAELIARQKLR